MHKHVLYVPVQHLDTAKSIALSLAGGYTASPEHEGAWADDAGRVHYDAISLLTVIEPGRTALDAITRALFERGELAVAFEIDGTPDIVSQEVI